MFLPTVISLLSFGLVFGEDCLPTWQENQASHQPSDLTGNDDVLMYLADTLKDELDFETHLDNILLERPMGSPGHGVVTDYLQLTMESLGWTVELDSFTEETPQGEMQFDNVFATLNPDSPRRFVLACHYDTTPQVDDGFVGATDSAAPCAMMINLAVTMKDIFSEQIEKNPELTPALLFFDGEEAIEYWTSTDSTYGSRHISSLWANTTYNVADGLPFCQVEEDNDLQRMDVMVLLDLVGAPEPQFPSFLFGAEETNKYSDMMFGIESKVDQLLPVSTPPMFTGVTSAGSSVSDDHTPFVKLGYENIFYVIDRPFPEVWHKMEDNKESLDFEVLERFNQLLRVFSAQYLQYIQE